jgi:hypothetical protein
VVTPSAGTALGGPTLDTGGDPQLLLEQLVEGVQRSLPAAVADAALEVGRDRSFGDRVAGRPGRVSELRLTGSDVVLVLRPEGKGARLIGEASRVVHKVVISRRSLPLGEWLTALAAQVGALAAEAAGDAAAAGQALAALGVRPAGFDLRVDEADVDGDLRTLVGRVAGRVPSEAQEATERVVDLLLETLPRVAGSGDAEDLVRRTATAYLPETLRAYLALPPEWATTQVLADGRTAAQSLEAQLGVLEKVSRDMRDAALGADASALLVNGAFLSQRFSTSGLDLPG